MGFCYDFLVELRRIIMFPTFWSQLDSYIESGLYYLASTFNLTGFFAEHRDTIDDGLSIIYALLDAIFDIVPNLVFGFFY